MVSSERPTGSRKPEFEIPQGTGVSVNNSSKYKTMGIMLLIAGVVSYLVVTFAGVTPTTLANKFVTPIMTSVNAITANQEDINKSIAEMKTNTQNAMSVANGANTTATGISNKVEQASNKADSASTLVNNLQSTVAEHLNKINALNETIKNQSGIIQAQADTINNLNTQIASSVSSINELQTKITGADTQIKDLQVKVAALQSQQTQTTTPTGTVVAAVTGNVFTGGVSMNFAAIPTSSSLTQTFTYQIDNQAGKILSNIQLALALLTTDTIGNNVALPTTVAVSVSSGNLSQTWTVQDTGVGYMKGFVTGTASGFASMFGTTKVEKGVTTYTVSVTVTNNGTVATSPMLVTPMIKVVNFQ